MIVNEYTVYRKSITSNCNIVDMRYVKVSFNISPKVSSNIQNSFE